MLNFLKMFDNIPNAFIWKIWGNDERFIDGWNYCEKDFQLIQSFCIEENILLVNRQG